MPTDDVKFLARLLLYQVDGNDLEDLADRDQVQLRLRAILRSGQPGGGKPAEPPGYPPVGEGPTSTEESTASGDAATTSSDKDCICGYGAHPAHALLPYHKRKMQVR